MVKISNINDVAKKLKELKEAISVCSKVEDQLSWAVDFTSYISITTALEPVLEYVDEAKEQLESEVDDIEGMLQEYKYKLGLFKEENLFEIKA